MHTLQLYPKFAEADQNKLPGNLPATGAKRKPVSVTISSAAASNRRVQRLVSLWPHLVDKTQQQRKQTIELYIQSSSFNTKSRYNIYIHGSKGKNKVHV